MTKNQNDSVGNVEKDGDTFVQHGDSFPSFIDWWIKVKPHDPDTADAALRDLVKGYVAYLVGEHWSDSPETNRIIQTVIDVFLLIKTLPADIVKEIITCYLHGRFAPIRADNPDWEPTIFEWFENKRDAWEDENWQPSQK